MPAVTDLPNELLLMIFPFLPLQSLLAARTVCRKWRHLAPLAPLPPSRSRLLALYDALLASPAFLATRPLVTPHLAPFDRAAYVAALPPTTPSDLTTFILEWPARAAVACLWPGLDARFNMSNAPVFAARKPARNCLAVHDDAPAAAPEVHTLDLDLHSASLRVRALEVYDEGNGWRHWLVLGSDTDDSAHAKVASASHDHDHDRALPPLVGAVYSSVRGVDGEPGYAATREADGWIAYVQQEVAREQARLEQAGLYCPCQACSGRCVEIV